MYDIPLSEWTIRDTGDVLSVHVAEMIVEAEIGAHTYTGIAIVDDGEIIEVNEIEIESSNCWNCEQRIGEECGIDGHEVYEDSECNQY